MRSVQSNNPVFQRSETLARATQSGVGFRTRWSIMLTISACATGP